MPAFFTELKETERELVVIEEKIAKGEEYDEEHAGEIATEATSTLEALLEGNAEDGRVITLITLESEEKISGPNPLYTPMVPRMDMNIFRPGGPTYVDDSECAEVDDYADQVHAIHTRLKESWATDPMARSGIEDWPEQPESKYGLCILDAVPDHDEIVLWHEIETIRDRLVRDIPELQTVHGEKIELEQSAGSSVFALDESPYTASLIGKLLTPLLLLLGLLSGFVAHRLKRT